MAGELVKEIKVDDLKIFTESIRDQFKSITKLFDTRFDSLDKWLQNNKEQNDKEHLELKESVVDNKTQIVHLEKRINKLENRPGKEAASLLKKIGEKALFAILGAIVVIIIWWVKKGMP